MGKYVTIKSGNGLSGSGVGHPKTMGVVGPGTSFMGTTMPQDMGRDANGGSGQGPDKKVPGNVGVKNTGRTGGRNRKFAGVVGPGSYSGTK